MKKKISKSFDQILFGLNSKKNHFLKFCHGKLKNQKNFHLKQVVITILSKINI